MRNLRVLKGAWPVAPFELQEAVELYAREHDRTGKLHFVPGGGWFARFNLRPNDKRLLLYQSGIAEEPPAEDVFFSVPREKFDPKVHPAIPGHEPRQGEKPPRPFIPLDVIQMGVSGVREFLEMGNTWSGRGVFNSHMESLKDAEEKNQQRKDRIYNNRLQAVRDKAKDRRRQILKIPFIGVGIDLRSNHERKGAERG